MSLRSSRLFKRAVLTIYWIALPVCLLAFVASFTTVSPEGAYQPSWATALVSGALAALIGWCLWLVGVMTAMLLLLTFVPEIVLFLPRWLGYL